MGITHAEGGILQTLGFEVSRLSWDDLLSLIVSYYFVVCSWIVDGINLGSVSQILFAFLVYMQLTMCVSMILGDILASGCCFLGWVVVCIATCVDLALGSGLYDHSMHCALILTVWVLYRVVFVCCGIVLCAA